MQHGGDAVRGPAGARAPHPDDRAAAHRRRSEGDGKRSDAAEKEAEDLEKLKAQIDAWSEDHGLAKEVQTSIAKRGLVVTVLTDERPLRLRQRRPQAGVAQPSGRIGPTAQDHGQESDPGRRQHRQRSRERTVPDQLGAVDGSGDLRGPIPHRTRREPGSSCRHGLRGSSPHRDERDGGRPPAQPAGGARRHQNQRPWRPGRYPGRVRTVVKGKLKFIMPLVALLVLGGAYKTVLAKPPEKKPEPKVHGERLRAPEGVPPQPRRRPLREADGRARARARRADRARPRAATRAAPPEGWGTLPQEAVIRGLVTDTLTGVEGRPSSSSPRGATSSRRSC